MTNFLVTSPSSETTGTLTADLFSLTTAGEITVFGLDGADTITSNSNAAISAFKLNAGKGADVVNITGGQVANGGSIFAGAGHDSIYLEKTVQSSVARAGQGTDTITFIGTLTDSTINGNDLADIISATISAASQTSLIAGGKGKDTLALAFDSGTDALTVNGGAGHDTITLSASDVGNWSAINIGGGAGKDTITFAGDQDANTGTTNLNGAINIDGGDQADLINFGSGLFAPGANATAAINGGKGADTVIFSASFNASGGTINLGAGADSISLQSALAGTINGGAGLDSITLSAYATTDGAGNQAFLIGGDNADTFALGLGTAGGGTVTGARYASGAGSMLRFDALTESTITNTDSVSAGVTLSGRGITGGTISANLFRVSQDAVSASAATIANDNFTGTNGVITFTAGFADTVTARAESLDGAFAKGQLAYFNADNGTEHYVFLAGGTSGTADDLLISLNRSVEGFNVDNNGTTNDSSFGVVIGTANGTP